MKILLDFVGLCLASFGTSLATNGVIFGLKWAVVAGLLVLALGAAVCFRDHPAPR